MSTSLPERFSRMQLAALTLALALLWPGWIAINNGLSDLYARPAIDYLEEKRFDDYAVTQAQWQAIESSVAKASALMPDNPRYLASLGWLHQLNLTLFADDLDMAAMDLHANAARDYFHKAVENRPTWSYYWGNLALEYHRRGSYATEQYSAALANAAYFGPWKNDTQRLVTDLGRENWAVLSPRAQRELLLNIERGLHRQPQNTVRIIDGLGGWTELCAASDTLLELEQPHMLALCQQMQLDRANR